MLAGIKEQVGIDNVATKIKVCKKIDRSQRANHNGKLRSQMPRGWHLLTRRHLLGCRGRDILISTCTTRRSFFLLPFIFYRPKQWSKVLLPWLKLAWRPTCSAMDLVGFIPAEPSSRESHHKPRERMCQPDWTWRQSQQSTNRRVHQDVY